jgi:hypothetical protein
MDGLDRVVEVGKVNSYLRWSLRDHINLETLNLRNKEFMVFINEILTFVGIKNNIVGINLGGARKGDTLRTFDAKLNLLILKSDQGKAEHVVVTEEEVKRIPLSISIARLGSPVSSLGSLRCGVGVSCIGPDERLEKRVLSIN